MRVCVCGVRVTAAATLALVSVSPRRNTPTKKNTNKTNLAATLGKMLPAQCTVLRDGGREARVDAVDLVPGDVVRLYIGDRVPADIRVLEAQELKVSGC